MSDTHLEFMRDEGKEFINSIPNKDVDILICAGDFTVLSDAHLALEQHRRLCDRFPQIIMIMGNHNFYHSSVSQTLDTMKQIEDKISNLHWLRVDYPFIKDGQRFIGDITWFEEQPDNICYQGQLNDFRLIKNFTPWVYEEFKKTKKYLNDNVTSNDIIVVHHIPSYSLVHPTYRNSSLNRFFIGNIDDIIKEKNPKLVLYGHSHLFYDTVLYNTRCIINPFGYPNENTGYNDKLILDI